MTTLNNTGDKITTLITNCVSFVFSPDSIMQKIYFRLSAANQKINLTILITFFYNAYTKILKKQYEIFQKIFEILPVDHLREKGNL